MRNALNLSGVVAEFSVGELIPADKMADPLRLFCEEFMPAFRQSGTRRGAGMAMPSL